MVLVAWLALGYGRPTLPELFCIFVHDIGYIGCTSMDGDDGRHHPMAGAKIAFGLFGEDHYRLCLGHSRYLASMLCYPLSKLCWADKLSFAYDPWWFYILRGRLSGEIKEYRVTSANMGLCPIECTDREWHNRVKAYFVRVAHNQYSSTSEVSGE